MLSLVPGFSTTTPAAVSVKNEYAEWVFEATNHLGQWIWDTNTTDKQTCRLWKTFDLPPGAKVTNATLRITVDNSFTLFLDGQEIGRGSDWRSVTEYDATRLLQKPGLHILAVDGFNDRLQAGMIFGLEIRLEDGRVNQILSDDSWSVVPNSLNQWTSRKAPLPGWHHAIVIASMNHYPWEIWPIGFMVEPPLRPVFLHFWQRGWFQLTLLVVCVLALLCSVWLLTQLSAQSASQEFLHLERARIARDIHDDFGAQLTLLVLLAEVARREEPPNSAAQKKFNQLCEQARRLSQALDEVVWAVNSRRDTLRDFVAYVCKYARSFLEATPIRCRLDVEVEIPAAAVDLPVRRNLLLAVKEALNNAAKYSAATELFLRISRQDHLLVVVVEDNGCGFDPELADRERHGLANMAHRMAEIGGGCELTSEPGRGCRVVFTVPLNRVSRRVWRPPWRPRAPEDPPPLKSGLAGPEQADSLKR
jgi:two-component sensor histidine kinase